MRQRTRNTMTPLLDVSASAPTLPILIESIIRLPPQKEHKVDGVLRICNSTSCVDPGRRGIRIMAGSDEFPILEESLFFGKDEQVSITYLGKKIIVEGSENYGLVLSIGYPGGR